MDEDATLAGETAQAAFIEETMAAEAEVDPDLAWSAEECVVDIGSDSRHWSLWAALVVVLCAVTAAAVWLATVFYQQEWIRPQKVTAEAPKVTTAPRPTEVAAPKALPAPGPPAQHEAPPPEYQPPPDADSMFLSEAAQIMRLPGFDSAYAEKLVEAAKVVCTALKNGGKPEDVIDTTMQNGASRKVAEGLFDAGTTIYCPKFAHR